MARPRTKGFAVLALSAGLILGTSGIADAVTVGVRGVFSGTRYVWSPKVRDSRAGRSFAGGPSTAATP